MYISDVTAWEFTENVEFVHAYKRDEPCRRYNSISGCKFGRYCMYHHVNTPNMNTIQPGRQRQHETNHPQPKNEAALKLDQLLERMATLTQLITVTASQQAHNRMQNGYKPMENHSQPQVPVQQQHYTYQQQVNHRQPNPIMQHQRTQYA